MARAAESLAEIPPANLFFIALCSGVYVCQLIFDPPLQSFTLCPRNVLFLHEYYRILTSSVFHGGLMHIGFNMLSATAIGSLLEKCFGTLRHMITVLWGMLLTSTVYIVIAYGASALFQYDSLMYQHSLGFSAVLFQLSVLEANLSPNASRSLFGMVQVPSYLYPWALLVAIQVIMPQISFVGHLAGIVVGYLQLYGLLDAVLLPSDEYLRTMEEWSSLRMLAARHGFVKTPSELSSARSHVRDPSHLISALRKGLGTAAQFIRDLLATLRAIIFGRGRGNENIALSRGGQSLLGTSWGDDDEDDDWVGLPSASTPTEIESRVV